MKNFKYIIKLIVIAILVGLFIALYQYLAHLVVEASNYLLNYNIVCLVITIICSVIVWNLLALVNKKMKGYYGSGIPQIEAYHRGTYNFSSIKMFFMIFINSIFAFFSGFLLGSEGPSISIGTSVAMTKNRICKEYDREADACGGSAGFACAFASPLAGLVHLIEENLDLLSFKLVLKGLLVISIAFITSYLVYPHNLLPYFEISFMPIKYYWLLLVVMVASILIGFLFMYLVIKMKDLTKGNQIMMYLTPIFLVGFMVLRRFYPLISGSGANVLDLTIFDYSLGFVLIVLVSRLIGTVISSSSNVAGGLVLPMLALGALVAASIIKAYSYIDEGILEYSMIFVVCAMFIVFAIVTKAPVTAFVLGLKCVTFTTIIIPMLISSVICIGLMYFYKYENIYHRLEKRIVPNIKEEKEFIVAID